MAFERAFWASPEKAALSFGQMNRSDLVQLLSDRFSQLTQGDAETAVSTILEAMCDRSRQIDLMAQGHFPTRDFGIDLFIVCCSGQTVWRQNPRVQALLQQVWRH